MTALFPCCPPRLSFTPTFTLLPGSAQEMGRWGQYRAVLLCISFLLRFSLCSAVGSPWATDNSGISICSCMGLPRAAVWISTPPQSNSSCFEHCGHSVVSHAFGSLLPCSILYVFPQRPHTRGWCAQLCPMVDSLWRWPEPAVSSKVLTPNTRCRCLQESNSRNYSD